MHRAIAATSIVLLVVGNAGGKTTSQNPQRPAKLFVFDDPFWLNLHHYLYVLGRAQAEFADSRRRAVAGAPADQAEGLKALDPGEQRAWQNAVLTYAKGPSTKDVIFDGDMVTLGRALVAAGDKPMLDSVGFDPQVIDAMRRAAPLYRKAWWPSHERANHALVARLEADLSKHGDAVHAYIARAYREPWAAGGFRVNVAAYANWSGAFSTSAGVLVVSSLDPAAAEGLKALEGVFHEAMHQWDDAMFSALSAEARRQMAIVPEALSHAMIFYTAGQAVRSVVPGHVPYADAEGVWARGMGTLKAALEATWKPYLDGRGTREEAIAALIKAVQ